MKDPAQEFAERVMDIVFYAEERSFGRRGLTGWFYANMLELVPGQEEVLEA